MTYFLIYDALSGELLQTSSSPWSPEQILEVWQVAPGQTILFVPELPALPFDQWYVVGGELVARPTMNPTVSAATIAADGAAECVISDLPDPCTVTVTGAVTAGPVELAGGTLTLTSTQPGEIRIAVRADPAHKPWETIIHAA